MTQEKTLSRYQNNDIWKQARIPILTLTFTTVLLVLVKGILLPTKDKITLNPLIFPKEVPLSQWQFVTSRPLPKPTKQKSAIISQKHYRYIQNNLYLDIEMRYLTTYDVSKMMKEYNSISSPAIVRQQEKVGYYGLGIDGQKAYLSACINPQGGSTFTQKQFNQNQSSNDLHPQHLVPWLLGQKGLKDNRCLWTHLSIPLNNSSPEAAYQFLEKVWFSWYQWWQPRFPQGLNK